MQLTKTEFTRQRRRIARALDHWRARLELDHWEGVISYINEPAPSSHPRDAGVAAEVDTSWAYERYEMRFWVPRFAEMDDDGLSQCVLHELCHVLIEPATKQTRTRAEQNLNEMVTTRLTRAIWNASKS